jgi:hypothetical protein
LGTSALLPHGAAGIAVAASSGFEEVDVQLPRVVLLLHAAEVARLLAQSDFADEPPEIEVVDFNLAPGDPQDQIDQIQYTPPKPIQQEVKPQAELLFRCRFNTEIGNQAWRWKRALISAYAKVPLR